MSATTIREEFSATAAGVKLANWMQGIRLAFPAQFGLPLSPEQEKKLFHKAIERDDYETVLNLAKKHPDWMTERPSQGDPAIAIAVRKNKPNAVRALLDAGDDPNATAFIWLAPRDGGWRENRQPLLHLAGQLNHVEIARILLENPATDISRRDDDYRTAVSTAMAKGNYTVVKMIDVAIARHAAMLAQAKVKQESATTSTWSNCVSHNMAHMRCPTPPTSTEDSAEASPSYSPVLPAPEVIDIFAKHKAPATARFRKVAAKTTGLTVEEKREKLYRARLAARAKGLVK
ncbi:MAG TPA: ankyrin repeat domain-containing protein [Patescibacteria group bacterium]|nr:ankyrin repeat domain-containing protein [Patescibacteria group bacterium]